MAKIIVNAVSYADLKVFCAALVLAMKEGKHYMARTAAAFTKVMGRISDQPLLGREQLEGDTRNGGIVLIGSHVKKTTDQLNCLKELDGQVDFMEFQVNTVFEENGLEKEVERTVKAAEEKILSGRTVVIYTSRQLLAPENMTPEEKLQISVKISNAVTSIIGKLSVKPKFIIAKGGITSSDVGTKALRVKKARVMGQVKKGIPVWMTGEESKFPGMPYIIFPGNVGEVSTLKEIVEELLNHRGSLEVYIMKKVIISLAPVQAGTSVDAVKLAEDVEKSVKLGAAMCHLHCRKPDGSLTPDISYMSECFDEILKRTDVVVQASTGGVSDMNIQDRCNPLDYPEGRERISQWRKYKPW